MADLLARRTSVVPAALGGTVVVLQIAYPLLDGVARDRLTVVIVIVFASACVAHAAVSRSARTAGLLLVLTAVPGFVAEVVGVHTGLPFGSYHYTSSLGPTLFGVPPVVGLAWTMVAWPAAIAARRLVAGRAARIVVGAWALASADLFLDPQMVAAGRWSWTHPTPHLPGVPDVPLTNFAGWLLVALLLSTALQTLLSANCAADDTVPILLYLWLYVGWIVALGGFLDLPAAAGWGALGMGLVAIPLAATQRPRWGRVR
ncbi:MAG: carotenoid biosynthesis protein [Jatrophihabitans sp.]